MKTKNTKKLSVIISLVFVLLVFTSSTFAACTLQNLGACSRSSLLVFIVQLLSNQQIQTHKIASEPNASTPSNSAITGIPVGFQFNTDLRKGSRSVDVKYLQILLNSDPDTSVGNAGEESSYFGISTQKAVINFQNKYASEILTPLGIKKATGVFGFSSRAKANDILNGKPTTPTCTSWTYSNWSFCSSNGQQTRTILSSSPNGCTGGNPVISQSCTPTTPTCTSWTYSNWSSCSSNGQQTRTILSSSPNGCTGGNPVISQSCTPTSAEEIYIPKAYITAYTWFDNTPPSSSEIALPIIHQYANGTGTYTDPITIAVGHVISGGKDTPDYPAGTRFYIPNVRAYFIVEDLCGDGNTPQNIPCHNLSQADSGATTWIDMWIDGQSGTSTSTNNCAEDLTGLHLVIQNPSSNYAVITGPIFQNGQCRQQYGDNLVNQ